MGFDAPATYTAAQLVQLCETEAICSLDDHQTGVGDVDSDFDDRGGDKNLYFISLETSHNQIFFGALHSAMHQTDLITKSRFQAGGPFFRCSEVTLFAFFDQWTNPVSLSAGGDMARKAVDHVWHARFGNNAGVNDLPAWREFIDARNIHLTILAERQGPRYRCRGHCQQMRCPFGFLRQHKALGNAELVLFVNDSHGKVSVLDLLLENGMGTDQDIDRTIHQAHQRRLADLALVAPGQYRQIDRQTDQQFLHAFIMLTRQNFRRGQKGTLITRFHSR